MLTTSLLSALDRAGRKQFKPIDSIISTTDSTVRNIISAISCQGVKPFACLANVWQINLNIFSASSLHIYGGIVSTAPFLPLIIADRASQNSALGFYFCIWDQQLGLLGPPSILTLSGCLRNTILPLSNRCNIFSFFFNRKPIKKNLTKEYKNITLLKYLN